MIVHSTVINHGLAPADSKITVKLAFRSIVAVIDLSPILKWPPVLTAYNYFIHMRSNSKKKGNRFSQRRRPGPKDPDPRLRVREGQPVRAVLPE